MKKIEYNYYTLNDADSVAELMVRNKFWIGRFKKNLTGEMFNEFNEIKGLEFGVVGRIEGRIISFVGAYRLGSQRVCSPNQIIMSGLLIDSKYRQAVYSISEMFSLVLHRAMECGFSDLISEVNKSNYPSLFLMRKTGFIVLDARPTVYGEIVLHNYLPAISECVESDILLEKNVLDKVLQPLDKKKLLNEAERINNTTIVTSWLAEGRKFEFFIDTEEIKVVGVHHVGVFQIMREAKNRYSYRRYSDDIPSKFQLRRYMQDGSVIDETITDTGSRKLIIETNNLTQKISITPPIENNHYYFHEIVKSCPQKYLRIPGAEIDCLSGYVYIGTKKEKNLMFMWPVTEAPFLESILAPNKNKQLAVAKRGNNYGLKQFLHASQIECTVAVVKNDLRITVSATAKPLIHFGLLTEDAEITVHAVDGTEKTYPVSQDPEVFAEYIFEDFHKLSHTSKAEYIVVRVDEQNWRISFDAPCACFVNWNYIGIKPENNSAMLTVYQI